MLIMLMYFINHQLVTFIIACVSAGVCLKTWSHVEKVLGDEDYSGRTWLSSLILPSLSGIAAVLFSVLFLLSLFFS